MEIKALKLIIFIISAYVSHMPSVVVASSVVAVTEALGYWTCCTNYRRPVMSASDSDLCLPKFHFSYCLLDLCQ